jgi:hypothetical protein
MRDATEKLRDMPPLSEAGLQVIHSFADFNRKPFEPGSERLICVAQRRTSDKGG